MHDKFRLNNFEFLHQNAGKELANLKSALNKFYLAKSKESLRMFEMTTAIEQKIHKNLKKKKHKKDSNIIDLDNLSDEEDEVQIV